MNQEMLIKAVIQEVFRFLKENIELTVAPALKGRAQP
jgi:hypothetical protein